ncbi:MAG: hypothetical protein Q7R97_04250 [Candidatus Daviesbacteria bacterium]|nr:hypothetical protein [Candidatus Daviesbacteria bacterium]
MNTKGFTSIIIILGIVLLLGIAGGAYYFGKSQVARPQSTQPTITPSSITDTSPAPTGTGETVNWKTYTDLANTYSMKYPSQLFPNTCGDGAFATESLYDCGSERIWLITVRELDADQLKSVRDLSIYSTISKKEVNINGDQYTQYNGLLDQKKWKGPGIYYSKIWVEIPHNSRYYELAYTKENEKDKDYSEIFDQILSTFKFIN